MSAVAVVATVEPSTGPQDPPRVRLDITDTGTPEVFSTTVTRLDPDGRTVPVRTQDGGPVALTTSGSTRTALLYDYEPPFGTPVTYSTTATPSASVTVTVVESRVWLIHPGVPALSMPLSVAAFGSRTRPVQRGLHWPVGSKHPVVQTDGQRKAPEGVIELNTFTLQELAHFEALTNDASTLLLNVPADYGWGVDTDYVSLGDLEEARLIEYAGEPRRLHSLPFQVVGRPEGGTQAERTYADVLADNATYADLRANYSTYFDVLAGP